MKTNGTLKTLVTLFVLMLGLTSRTVSQPDYRFINPVLLSGKDNEVGAQYRFSNVKAGVDALVSINFISTDVGIQDFDDNKNGGFDEAFQPRIKAKGKTSGYAEFTITFVKAGTSTPMVQAEIPATSIDVDGTLNKTDTMLEFDEYLTPGAYFLDYDLINTDLHYTFNTGRVLGKNFRGVEKAAIDTVAMEAMFTVVYPNTSSITVRIGLDNQLSSSTIRQRSVYFKRFHFTNSFLPLNNLVSFAGNRNKNGEPVLNWQLRAGHEYATAIVEKSTDGFSYSPVGNLSMNNKNSASLTDISSKNSAAYYRLRMVDKSGKSSLSAVLYMRSANLQASGKLNVYPSIVNDNTNISFSADNSGPVSISLFDQSGRMILNKQMMVQSGTNTINLDGLNKFNNGQYVLVVNENGNRYARQLQLAY